MDQRNVRPHGVRFQTERNTLFHRNRNDSNGSAAATASEAVAIQQSLQRTQQLLQHELDRVSTFQSAIEDDGKLLQQAMDAHKSLNVKGAKKALTALERAQQNERNVLRASIIFFWSCVFYVLWCRVLIKLPFVGRIMDILLYDIWTRVVRLDFLAEKLVGLIQNYTVR